MCFFLGDLMLAGFVDACTVGLKSLMNAVGPLATMAVGGGAGKAIVATNALSGNGEDKNENASGHASSTSQGVNVPSENETQGNQDLLRIVTGFIPELAKFSQFFNPDKTLNVKAIEGKQRREQCK